MDKNREYYMDEYDEIDDYLYLHQDEYDNYWSWYRRKFFRKFFNPDDSGRDGYFTNIPTEKIKKAYEIAKKYMNHEPINFDSVLDFKDYEDDEIVTFEQAVEKAKSDYSAEIYITSDMLDDESDVQDLELCLEDKIVSVTLKGRVLDHSGFRDYSTGYPVDRAYKELWRLAKKYNLHVGL